MHFSAAHTGTFPEDRSETKVEGLVVKKNPNRATFAILWREFDCLIVVWALVSNTIKTIIRKRL